MKAVGQCGVLPPLLLFWLQGPESDFAFVFPRKLTGWFALLRSCTSTGRRCSRARNTQVPTAIVTSGAAVEFILFWTVFSPATCSCSDQSPNAEHVKPAHENRSNLARRVNVENSLLKS